jgi:hypothetical protein
MTAPPPEPRDLVPLPPPPPGLSRLRRRLADRAALRDALLAGVSETPDPDSGGALDLGARLDVAGDPTLLDVAAAWGRVADGVAAYTELTAGETYLATAQDWTDLRRVVDLIGYRPAQRSAAHGWLRVDIDPTTNPLLPAGTQVQAPPVPGRAAQTFAVAADTQLQAQWRAFTATAVPQPAPPGPGHEKLLRFLADPGIAPPDKVLLVSESTPTPPPLLWWDWLFWLIQLIEAAASATTAVGVAGVSSRADDLGAFLIGFDRSLVPLLPAVTGTSYALYRIRQTLTVASRLDVLSYVQTSGTPSAQTVSLAGTYGSDPAPVVTGLPFGHATILVTDGSGVSVGQLVAVYAGVGKPCTIATVTAVDGLDWHVAPGTTSRVTQLTLDRSLPSSVSPTVMLVDDRVVAQHYDLPDLAPGGTQIRLHPRPAAPPPRLAVQTIAADGSLGWETVTCTPAAASEPTGTGDAGGMLLDLDSGLAGTVSRGAATGNVAPIEHGATTSATLPLSGGVAVVAGPVTGDVDAHGVVTDSLMVQVDGVRFDEVGSLYGRGPAEQVYATRLAADGRLVLNFGDGVVGAAPSGTVTGSWRVGGGLAGEIPGAEITTLLGRVTGVRTVAGVGPTVGAADQEDPLRIRNAAAASIRALDRAVSANDLADLALTVPGTSHSVVWRGTAPDGTGSDGLNLAALRRTSDGVRAPYPAELTALSGYLDARRDTTVPLRVSAGVASPVTVTLTIDTDPRRDPTAVAAAVEAAVTAPAGPLAAVVRALGQPLDGSDIVAVAQPVTGVVGIRALNISGGLLAPTPGDQQLGRFEAAPYELLAITTVTVTASPAGATS